MEDLSSFETWYLAGTNYSKTIVSSPQEQHQIGEDIAWYNEGNSIVESDIATEYQEWLNGTNPYSPHHIPYGEGYDYEGEAERHNHVALIELTKYADNAFIDDTISAEKFITLVNNDILHVNMVSNANFFQQSHENFLTGRMVGSPHYIPLDETNIQVRLERINHLHETTTYSDFMFNLLYKSRHKGYGSLE